MEVPRGAKVWLLSRRTLEQVAEVYDSLRFPQVEKRFPKFLVKLRPLEMPLWQWIAILLFAPIALLLGWLVALLLRRWSQRIRRGLGPGSPSREPLRRWGPARALAAV